MRSSLPCFAAVILFAVFLPATQAAASPYDLLVAGRVDEAIRSLQAQLKSSPNDAPSYNYLCRAYFALGDWDRSISAAEKSVALVPGEGDFHLWLGRAYGEKAGRVNPLAALGLAGKVRKEFERAVELNPSSVEARSDLAEFYIDAPRIVGGGVDKARAQANALMKLSPAKAHYIKGRLAEKNRDISTAESEYRSAIEASREDANDWLNLALLYRHTNRLDDMKQALNRAATAPSGQNDVLVECAEILLGVGRDSAAASRLARRYIAAGTPSEKAPLFKAHYVLGSALEQQGDTQGAAQEYRASLALASNFRGAKESLKRLSK